MRERLAEADERITDWMLTNTGVVISLLVWFVLFTLVAALLG